MNLAYSVGLCSLVQYSKSLEAMVRYLRPVGDALYFVVPPFLLIMSQYICSDSKVYHYIISMCLTFIVSISTAIYLIDTQ